jgi:RNA recognition motif-containing protein
MISIHIVTENEFICCKRSNQFLAKNNNKTETTEVLNDLINKKIFVKIKSIPYSAKENSIYNIFKDYLVTPNSIRFLRNKKGYFEGEAIIAFLSEQEAEKAYREKKGEMLFTQNLILELSNLEEFERFAFSEAFNYMSKILPEIIIPQNVFSSLFVCNFPLDYSKENVMKIFEIFNLVN